MDDEPTILQVIDRIGAWAVLIASEREHRISEVTGQTR